MVTDDSRPQRVGHPPAMDPLQRLRSHLHEYGFRDTAGRVLTRALMRAFPRAFRQREVPTLGSLNAAATGGASTTAAELVRAAGVATTEEIDALSRDYAPLRRELDERYRRTPCPFPLPNAVGEESSFLLYALVRLLKPRAIVEAGVGNGHSTWLMLQALACNRAGQLHSIDVRSDVGALLTEDERRQWNLHLLHTAGLKKSFLAALLRIGPADFFHHDSENSYQWMEFELDSVLAAWGRSTTFCVNGIHLTCSFLDFCSRNSLQPRILLDRRKALGVILGAGIRK